MMSDRLPRRTTGAQVQARDRQLVAVHEAGHLVMSRHLGASGALAIVFQNIRPAEHEKLGGGRAIRSLGSIDHSQP